jgi:hypothetical protein
MSDFPDPQGAKQDINNFLGVHKFRCFLKIGNVGFEVPEADICHKHAMFVWYSRNCDISPCKELQFRLIQAFPRGPQAPRSDSTRSTKTPGKLVTLKELNTWG